MKFVILMVSAAVAGALSMFLVPTTIVRSGTEELRQFRLADLNPLRLIFDYEQKQRQTPLTPAEMGFHGSPVILKPISPPATLKLDLSQSLQTQGDLGMQQSDRHMQDMQAYTRDPDHQVGPPPN